MIAIVGGPSAVYAVKDLLQKADDLYISIFEAGPVGTGRPGPRRRRGVSPLTATWTPRLVAKSQTIRSPW